LIRRAPPSFSANRDRQDGERIHAEHDKRQDRIAPDHVDDEREDHHPVADGGVEPGLQRHLDLGDVVRQAGDEVAGAVPRQAREIGLQKMSDRHLLHVDRDRQHDAARRDRRQIQKNGADGRRQNDQTGNDVHLIHAPLGQHVEGVLDEAGIEAGDDGEGRHQQERAGQLAPLRADPVGEDAPQQVARRGIEAQRRL
jgi:hypothetical protein